MSGVYIRGVEMPTSCLSCKFHKSIYCVLTNICTITMQNCPLIPVPNNGRLIDANALRVDHFVTSPTNSTIHLYVSQKQIDEAPTIIPAD